MAAVAFVNANYDYQRARYGRIRVKIPIASLLR
jgi:hypothetical protein